MQSLQNQQEQKAAAEKAKSESASRPADKGKIKKEANSRSSKNTDNALKTSGRKRGLGYSESENPGKRQKVPNEPVKEADQAKAPDAPADMDSSMEDAGNCCPCFFHVLVCGSYC